MIGTYRKVTKRLKTLEKNHQMTALCEKNYENYLLWSVQTCNGNVTVLVDKITSVLYHISNIRSVEW